MTASTLSEIKIYRLAETGMKNYIILPVAAGKVCNLDYLINISRGNKKIIDSILASFFIETKIEIIALGSAIKKRNYITIRHIAHKIKSAFLILGITALEPVFKELEQLSSNKTSNGNIELLDRRVNLVFNQAKEEMLAED
jgi:hypothetical protein